MTSPTRYERTLANCARSLSDFIALQLDEQADEFWPAFRSWVNANRQAATMHAGAFIGEYMAAKADKKTQGERVTNTGPWNKFISSRDSALHHPSARYLLVRANNAQHYEDRTPEDAVLT